MLRSFLGTLAALALVHAVDTDHLAFAWWIAAGVVLVAFLELAVSLVRRKLAAPGRAPRSTS